jgi:acetyl-CoA C-acetyltransferase
VFHTNDRPWRLERFFAPFTLEGVDLFELNDAFSVQAVALGHSIGASGARILTTLLYALQQRGLTRGIATLCPGGGNGVPLAVERL